MYVTLRRGDVLPTVALAQSRLIESGATDLVVDGVFGKNTGDAVLAFQAQVNIPQTAAVDPATWLALQHERPIKVIDVIDATDITVLQDDRPYLDTGYSTIIENYGMSAGARHLINLLATSYAPRSVALLRLHGHGNSGVMVVTGGTSSASGAGIATEHFRNPKAVAEYARIGTIMKPYGSIELHGCHVAMRNDGRELLNGLARATKVPVSAAFHSQLGGNRASRFEGPVLTTTPGGEKLSAWAKRVFSMSESS